MAAHKGSLGDWVRIARSVEPELAAASRAERREVLERAARRHGRKPSTIHRMVRAYRYALTHGKAVGMEVDRIQAPVVSIEVLERLERRGEAISPDLRREVLSGEVSFQQLRDLESASKVDRVTRVRGSDVDWRAFAIELSYDLFSHGKWSSAFGADRNVYSQIARNLSVDWEIEFETKRVAVFLSPQCVFSEFRGKTVLEQLPRAVMATLFYDRVIYLPWDDVELRLTTSYLPPECLYETLLSGRLEIVSFMSTPQGRANGEAYRT